jgi:hypothetical protein
LASNGTSPSSTALSLIVFKFKNVAGPLTIHTLDLLVLLALAEYNSPKTSITALNFFFTGGIIQKQWEIRRGMGHWSSASAFPHCLNLYLQSEAIGVLNTALVALMCILVHWFVTRVSSKQTKINFGSNRNKPKQDLFRVRFGLFHETKN